MYTIYYYYYFLYNIKLNKLENSHLLGVGVTGILIIFLSSVLFHFFIKVYF